MRNTAPILLALALALQGTAHAELLRGEVSGIVPTTIPWRASTIKAGMPFRLEFTIDTESEVGPWWGDNMLVDLYVNGKNQTGDRPDMYPLNGPADAGRSGLGLLVEDSLTGSWLTAPDNLFVIAFTIPNKITLPLSNRPLQGLTLQDITGVTFGFADADEAVKVPILLANNLPLSTVPEPSTWLLGALALLGVLPFRRRLATVGLHGADSWARSWVTEA